jgi:hypothetical protein
VCAIRISLSQKEGRTGKENIIAASHIAVIIFITIIKG